MTSLYDDAETTTQEPAPDRPPTKEDQRGGTSVLPKEFFGSSAPEVGQRCTVEVTRVHEDSVEVQYVSSESEKEESEEAESGPEAPPPGPPGPPGAPSLYE